MLTIDAAAVPRHSGGSREARPGAPRVGEAGLVVGVVPHQPAVADAVVDGDRGVRRERRDLVLEGTGVRVQRERRSYDVTRDGVAAAVPAGRRVGRGTGETAPP